MNGRRRQPYNMYTAQTETGKIDGSMVIKRKRVNDYRVHQRYTDGAGLFMSNSREV